MEGLRQKAAKLPFAVYTTDIRPGFVDTAMAKGEGLFWVTPVDKAVKQIKKAISDRKKSPLSPKMEICGMVIQTDSFRPLLQDVKQPFSEAELP